MVNLQVTVDQEEGVGQVELLHHNMEGAVGVEEEAEVVEEVEERVMVLEEEMM